MAAFFQSQSRSTGRADDGSRSASRGRDAKLDQVLAGMQKMQTRLNKVEATGGGQDAKDHSSPRRQGALFGNLAPDETVEQQETAAVRIQAQQRGRRDRLKVRRIRSSMSSIDGGCAADDEAELAFGAAAAQQNQVNQRTSVLVILLWLLKLA